MLRRCARLLGLLLSLAGAMPLVHASPAIDALKKCMYAAVTRDDRATLVLWLHSVYALHPTLQPDDAISTEQREKRERAVAAVYERLWVKDCKAEVAAARMSENDARLMEGMLTPLVGLAVSALMRDPRVQNGFKGPMRFIDRKLLMDAVTPRR